MNEHSKNRTKWIHLRLKNEEYEVLHNGFKKSICRKLSEYARKILLQKPLVLKYRNESLDELILELIQLRKELNGIGNNYNQSVKKLHTISEIPEFRHWILAHQIEKELLFNAILQIQNHTKILSEKWLQS